MTLRPLAAFLTAVALAGCTSVVAGRGRAGVTSLPPRSSAAPPTASLTVPSGTNWPPAGLLRLAPATDIGDPVTDDLCAAIGLQTMSGLGAGLTPSFDARQYPPGCSVTLRQGTTPILGVSVFGASGQPTTAAGRATRTVAGIPVYAFPFDASGDCRREVNPLGVLLTVSSAPQGSAQPEPVLDCAATDAMANRLAKVAAVGTLPQLRLPSRSVSALDSCKVVAKAGITSLPAFANGAISEQGFGASCEVRPPSAFLFFNYVIADAARPNGARLVVVDGHRLYETSAQPNFCSYVSTQASTLDGRYEQIAASATTSASSPPAKLCAQTAQALARYLGAADLS